MPSVLLTLINDSIQYDDEKACLQAGIYREIKSEDATFNFELVPNPASDQVTLRILNEQKGFCNLQISNVLGKIIFETKFDCEKSEHIIATDQLNSGTYFVKVKI